MNNLPTPMSRIEELIYAFITRDMSKISEPKSRIEEYWYYILTGTNTLRVPKSRVEELLKRLIENNTTDIPVALSRIEEFLIDLLTSGTVSFAPKSRIETYLNYMLENNIGIKNVEYLEYTGTNITATNTIEAPIKSAILKGMTLVNKIDFTNGIPNGTSSNKVDDTITVIQFLEGIWKGYSYKLIGVVCDKEYIVHWNSLTHQCQTINQVIGIYGNYISTGKHATIQYIREGNNYFKFTIPSTVDINTVVVRIHATTDDSLTNMQTIVKGLKVLEYQEGMENWDIPYFEGMQSVKMPVLSSIGKNLIVEPSIEKKVIANTDIGNNATILLESSIRCCFVESSMVEVGKNYAINSYDKTYQFFAIQHDKNGTITRSSSWRDTNLTFVPSSNFVKILVRRADNDILTDDDFVKLKKNFMMSEITSIDTYEPYKSNILSTPSNLELRGIGDVKDTLDLVTGELTQRIGEVVLDGSEDWFITNKDFVGNTKMFQAQFPSRKQGEFNLISNILPTKNIWGVDSIGIMGATTVCDIRIRYQADDVADFKAKLKLNPITVQYELATPIIKTVDLSIINKDGNPVTKLSAFNDVTYIESLTTAENSLVGEVTVEVPTKVEDTYNAVQILLEGCKTSLAEIDEIQNEQEMDSILVMNSQAELYDLILSNAGGDVQ